MKRIYAICLSLAFCLASGNLAYSQVVLPDLSPFATVTQDIGTEEIKIEYSRPSVRGRIIFGDLVPYGSVWRAGANASTKIYIREEVTVHDKIKIAPGVYALYAIPNQDEWTIIINRDAWLWGVFGYNPSHDVARFNVKPQPLKEQVETFTIQFANVCASCAEVQLMWDFTKVSFRISTPAEEKVLSDIKTFTANPEARLAGDYYLSAKYYLDTNRDLNMAMEWIDKALKYTPGAYWMTHTKAEIYAKMGKYNDAIETARLSIEQAKLKNDEDYVRMNEMEIEKWKNVKKGKSGS